MFKFTNQGGYSGYTVCSAGDTKASDIVADLILCVVVVVFQFIQYGRPRSIYGIVDDVLLSRRAIQESGCVVRIGCRSSRIPNQVEKKKKKSFEV